MFINQCAAWPPICLTCQFCYWGMMCMFPSQWRNAVVQPARKKIANKKFCSRSWVMLPCASPKGACALLNWWLMTPPTRPLSSSPKRGVVRWLARQQLRQHPCGGWEFASMTACQSPSPSRYYQVKDEKLWWANPSSPNPPILFHPWGGVPSSWVIRMQLTV